MKRKKWTAKEKLEIVLEGLKGQCSVAELCTRYGIQQSMYYKWRDQLLKNGKKVYDGDPDRRAEHLESQVKQLTALVGHLTVELKKTELELL